MNKFEELKKINTEKQNILKQFEKDSQKKNLEKLESNRKEIELSFSGEYEAFQYLSSLLKFNNLTIDTVGREIQSENIIDGKEFFLHIFGLEKDIYNFIYELEKTEKKISIINESILLEVDENKLDLKMNIMYIINNKNYNIDYNFYNNGIFEKSKIRDIGKKRRKL